MSRPNEATTRRVADRIDAVVRKWYPKSNEISRGSSYRATEDDGGTWSYHNGQYYNNSPSAAIDYSENDAVTGSYVPGAQNGASAAMRDFAKWWFDNFGDLTIQEFHTTPYPDDIGFNIANQVKNTGDVAGHANHIHLAESDALLAIIEARSEALWGSQTPAPIPDPTPGPVSGSTFGWDASNHDWGRGALDLQAAKNDGISFFVHKIGGIGPSEGGRYEDRFFGEGMRRARATQVPVLGSYFVVCPQKYASAAEQVGYWVELLNKNFPEWRSVPMIHQIDAEKWGYADYPASAADIRDIVNEWHMRGLPGYLIGYLPDEFYASAGDLGVDLWLPDYHTNGSHYKELYPGDSDYAWQTVSAGRKPRILQYASDATIGTQRRVQLSNGEWTGCDANKFNGSLEELIRLAGGQIQPTPTPTPQPTPGDDELQLSDTVPSTTSPDVPNRNLDQVLGDIWSGVHHGVPALQKDVDALQAELDALKEAHAAAPAPVPVPSPAPAGGGFSLDKYAKAVVAALVTGVGTYTAYKSGGVTVDEWTQIGINVLAALGITWAVPNKTDKSV